MPLANQDKYVPTDSRVHLLTSAGELNTRLRFDAANPQILSQQTDCIS